MLSHIGVCCGEYLTGAWEREGANTALRPYANIVWSYRPQCFLKGTSFCRVCLPYINHLLHLDIAPGSVDVLIHVSHIICRFVRPAMVKPSEVMLLYIKKANAYYVILFRKQRDQRFTSCAQCYRPSPDQITDPLLWAFDTDTRTTSTWNEPNNHAGPHRPIIANGVSEFP